MVAILLRQEVYNFTNLKLSVKIVIHSTIKYTSNVKTKLTLLWVHRHFILIFMEMGEKWFFEAI